MLIAILMLYFNSDLTLLSPQQLVDAGVVKRAPATRGAEPPSAEAAFNAWLNSVDPTAKRFKAIRDETDPAKKTELHTFNILALQKIGQLEKSPFDRLGWLNQTIQWWAFLLLFIGFVIKVPSVPLHTWLPDAHVEAPTPISMILAGVLLKMGGYGIIRICYPICPAAGYQLAYFVCLVGVVSMVWGAFAAMAQNDFKRLVAYSSVSHMGYVVLGLGVWSLGMWTGSQPGQYTYVPDYWKMGVNGAMFQMIAHGISSAGMFFCVGVLYDRVHHRNLNEFGGIFGRMPVYAGLAIPIFFAGLGLPGLCGFIGEVFVVLSVWNYNQALAVISAAVVILTAGYILWAIQRVYLGGEYRGPHPEALIPATMREILIAVPLVVFAVILGVYPQSLLNYMQPSVDRQVEQLAAWTEKYDAAKREALRPSRGEEDEQMTAAAK
jgi:NADH-quinone oxidoreductase subunit M